MNIRTLPEEIRTAKFGHFEDVIKSIDKMLETLKEEGASDLAKKTQCLDEYQHITKTVNDLDWKIKNNEAKIAKLEKLIELRTQEKQDTIAKIKDTRQYMADITKEREDDQDATKLLTDAKAAFAKFYKENGIKMIQQPEFERSADDAPDATFSNKGKNKNQSKGILELFDYILEDIADELANSKKAEIQAQTEYEDEMATAKK